MTEDIYQSLDFYTDEQFIGWRKVKLYGISVILACSDLKQIEKITKDLVKSTIDGVKDPGERELIEEKMKDFTIIDDEEFRWYDLGNIYKICIYRKNREKQYSIGVVLPYSAEIANSLSHLKLNSEYKSVTINIPGKITDAGIEVINNHHKKYKFNNTSLEEIEKIDPDKICEVIYDITGEPDREGFYPKNYLEVVNNLKTSNKISLSPLHYYKLKNLNFYMKERPHYYQSGSLLNSSGNINFKFRYNLFFTIACNLFTLEKKNELKNESNEELNLVDNTLSDFSDDLLFNPLVLMKIAKFSHVESNSESDLK